VRAADDETTTSSLGAVPGLGKVKEWEAYEALDWLVARQRRIENDLARRHLQNSVLVLYDVSSSYFEGRCCPLTQYGHSRDHPDDWLQIVYGTCPDEVAGCAILTANFAVSTRSASAGCSLWLPV
jgi:hypothetical protein